MKLQRYSAGHEIKDCVDDAAPVVLQDEAGEPQKPHVSDDVQPAAMQKIRR